jgi:hypothetical protein
MMVEGFRRQAVLLSLLQSLKEHGSWCGETHIQKSAFFLEEGLSVPLGLEFIMYKYGPFSSDLRMLLGEMRANYLIEVEPREPYGPSLVVSDSGRDLLGRFLLTLGRYHKQIEFVATRLGPRSVAELERLGTALFVTRGQGSSATNERALRIMELKPHIDRAQAEEAVGNVDILLDEVTKLGLGREAATR